MSLSKVLHFYDYLSPSIQADILSGASNIGGSGRIRVKRAELSDRAALYESDKALEFCCQVYDDVRDTLAQVLERREQDRAFIDEQTRTCAVANANHNTAYTSEQYATVIGDEDANGRIVIGPLSPSFRHGDPSKPVAPLPAHLTGKHVTLFGPPDSPKMSINAMNCAHRRIADEPQVVADLVAKSTIVPKWGADDEDSKTPLHDSFLAAGVSLQQCFDRSLRIDNDPSGKVYEIKQERTANPIKRIPGLAMPSTSLYYDNAPVPMHIYDFALHVFNMYHLGEECLTFYVPKLENEEEAAYLHTLISKTEDRISVIASANGKEYRKGSIRIFLVFENPRAIFRINEMIDALYPYFAGGSLGWHDYLASAARLFREDPHYRIPVKADPNIVIKNIRESHALLANVVGPRQGVKIGGMYGVLPRSNTLRDPSFQVCMVGYIRDVTTQLKRGLDGFWVAHPDFVRIGIAITEAWFSPVVPVGDEDTPISSELRQLVPALVLDPQRAEELLTFITGPDLAGLDPSSTLYPRAVLAADINVSDVIANDDPKEVAYNIFQALQYLADWLAGNGCVALPAIISGESVRVMDDLATTERSRWEVWAEVRHGRVSMEQFITILGQEVAFIARNGKENGKEVHVQWNTRTAKWYPVAVRLLVLLCTHPHPVEFATELLLPFTLPTLRSTPDPWQAIQRIEAEKFTLPVQQEKEVVAILSTCSVDARL